MDGNYQGVKPSRLQILHFLCINKALQSKDAYVCTDTQKKRIGKSVKESAENAMDILTGVNHQWEKNILQ